ncbi:type 4a pilus biogenesis protein PilF [Oceaniserpentilla sp. 4NH20-0058]|uniref:type IV pilus biogenesis/stability protein PilW n=1 Tax=Oceaniserpentilla sp. 4NH20-0058 TaxID=3127660 RepID=UPI00310B8CC2
MNIVRNFVLSCLALMLAGCVTVTDSRFTKKIDNDKAVENYVALGVAYIQNGNMALARKKIERALEISPESASAHSAMATYWVERGEYELAEKEFSIALNHNSQHSPTNYHYGRFLFSVKNKKTGCDYIKRAATDVDYTARGIAFENLGLCHEHFDETRLAVDAFEKAWSLDTNSTVSSLSLAGIYLKRKRPDIAKRWFERFERTLKDQNLNHTASSLYVGVIVFRAINDKNAQASYAFKLKKRFPQSGEYKAYLASER